MPKVSVIVAAYNAGTTIGRALSSLVEQDLSDWEAIVVNDGSTDDTLQAIGSVADERIKTVSIPHSGVSAARNAGIKAASGAYFCFLDADDLMPSTSLGSRADILDKDRTIDFVDGLVEQVDEESGRQLSVYEPTFKGEVVHELIRFRSSCFCGNTWMIRRNAEKTYAFDETITHAEDLMFYLSIADKGMFDHTPETILQYRRNPSSAMSDIRGMETGLFAYMKAALARPESTFSSQMELKYRMIRAAAGSHFHNGSYALAFRAFFRFLFA